jgi:hypothetical protein
LSVQPDPIALGAIPAGKPASGRFTVSNPTTQQVHVDQIDTTCECLKLTPTTFDVESGGSIEIQARFNPDHDPQFRGSLSVGLTGYGGASVPVFRTRITLEVRE